MAIHDIASYDRTAFPADTVTDESGRTHNAYRIIRTWVCEDYGYIPIHATGDSAFGASWDALGTYCVRVLTNEPGAVPFRYQSGMTQAAADTLAQDLVTRLPA